MSDGLTDRRSQPDEPPVEEQRAKGALSKDTNPKDAVGIRKAPMSVLPRRPLYEAALGLLEGGRKYGRHNYRIAGVRGSVYFDATMRHLDDWWEGTDIDPDSGLSHITKAICSLLVLRDAMLNDMWMDDRPPKLPEGWLREVNELAGGVVDRYPDAKDPYTQLEHGPAGAKPPRTE